MRVHTRIDVSALRQHLLTRMPEQILQQTHRAVRRALERERREIEDAAREQVARGLQVRRESFLKSVRAKVLSKDRRRLPALVVYSRIPWLGIHQRGGLIQRKMLIPLPNIERYAGSPRIGRKTFRNIVDRLMRQGNAFFIRARSGKVLLMAENIRESDPYTRRSRAHQRRVGRAPPRYRRGDAVPIAMLVHSVRLRKRFDIPRTLTQRLPQLVAAIAVEFQHLR